MTRLAWAAAALAAATVAPLAVGAPAHGEDVWFRDAADATASPTDIRNVRVDHTEDRVHVRIKFTDLATGMDNATSSASIFFDTDRSSAGPEYVLGIPLFEGADWAVVPTAGWRPADDEPMHCPSQLRLRPDRSVATAWVSRACLDRPRKVRVSIRMNDWSDGSHMVRDWAPRRKAFTRWLARG